MKEKTLAARPGMPMLVLFILLYLAMIALIVLGGNLLSSDRNIGALPLVFGIWGLCRNHSLFRISDYQAPGGLGSDLVWELHRNAEGTRILFCTSLFVGCKSRSKDSSRAEFRCGSECGIESDRDRSGWGSGFYTQQEDLSEDHDSQQCQTKSERRLG